MSRAGLQLRKLAISIHRWLGVTFCLLFAMWFLSGMVLMYWDYPQVGEAERLAHAQTLDVSRVRLSPAEAYARLKIDASPEEARLTMFDGRPAYEFGAGAMVYADDGQPQIEFPRELTARIASAWNGQPAAAASVEVLNQADQWTVSGEFAPLRPLLKYSWPDGQQVYVSEAVGQVVQYTTRASRLGAYFGAIPHWLYFTPLRKNGRLWTRIVIWASGIGTVTSMFGLLVGVWVSVSAKRIPYAGQKRWHAMFGLIFGVIACTWAFSGMLSMDPFPFRSADRQGAFRIESALRGGDLDLKAFAGKPPREALAGLKVKAVEMALFAGEPAYLATEAPGRSWVIPVEGRPVRQLASAGVLEIVAAALQPVRIAESRVVTQYEAYYLDRHHEHPLPALFVRLDNPDRSMYYIDLHTGHVVESYGSGARWNRWLYHGLHSLDLPWLYRHRPAWDLAVLALMLGGAFLSVTSVIIGGQLLARKLR